MDEAAMAAAAERKMGNAAAATEAAAVAVILSYRNFVALSLSLSLSFCPSEPLPRIHLRLRPIAAAASMVASMAPPRRPGPRGLRAQKRAGKIKLRTGRPIYSATHPTDR